MNIKFLLRSFSLTFFILAVVIFEERTSFFQSAVFYNIFKDSYYYISSGKIGEGDVPLQDIVVDRSKVGGPYDVRSGYGDASRFIKDVGGTGLFGLKERAVWSPKYKKLYDEGLFLPYDYKESVGLIVKDKNGAVLEDNRLPKMLLPETEAVNEVNHALYFIEDGQILGENSSTYLNYAVDYKRFFVAGVRYVFFKFISIFNGSAEKSGGASTLLVQEKKFKHSPDGLTEGVDDKFKQIASAFAYLYRDGITTKEKSYTIIKNYLNSIPLGADERGEIYGLAEALNRYYGLSRFEIDYLYDKHSFNCFHDDPSLEYNNIFNLRLAMGFIVSLRRPSYYLGDEAGRIEREKLVDFYLKEMIADKSVFSDPYEKALKLSHSFIFNGKTIESLRKEKNRNSFDVNKACLYSEKNKKSPIETISEKTLTTIKNDFSKIIGEKNRYDLSNKDFKLTTSIDLGKQKILESVLEDIKSGRNTDKYGLYGERLLSKNEEKRVDYAINLYELENKNGVGMSNLVASYETDKRPSSFLNGGKFELGSTAKLRVLTSFLQLMEQDWILFNENKDQIKYCFKKDLNEEKCHSLLRKIFNLNEGRPLGEYDLQLASSSIKNKLRHDFILNNSYKTFLIDDDCFQVNDDFVNINKLRYFGFCFFTELYFNGKLDISKKEFLYQAMNIKINANPNSLFYTGGGLHKFDNFNEDDDHQYLTIDKGFSKSNNLVFVRLFRYMEIYLSDRREKDLSSLLNSEEDDRRSGYIEEYKYGDLLQYFNIYRRKSKDLELDSSDKKVLALGYAIEKLIKEDVGHSILTKKARNNRMRIFSNYNGDDYISLGRSCYGSLNGNSGGDSNEDNDSILCNKEGNCIDIKEDELQDEINGFDVNKEDVELGTVKNFNWQDVGYIGKEHPVRFFTEAMSCLNVKLRSADFSNRKSKYSSIIKKLQEESYAWVDKKSNYKKRNLAVRKMVEEKTFLEILDMWKSIGYPYNKIVPSLGTALGSSGDRPKALADLLGVIVSGGLKPHQSIINSINFAEGTPYEFNYEKTFKLGNERLLSKEISESVLTAMGNVVDHGTGISLKGKKGIVSARVKTGTGDNKKVFKINGTTKEIPLNRSATSVFNINEKYYGVLVAYTIYDGKMEETKLTFTSSLPNNIVRVLAEKGLFESAESKKTVVKSEIKDNELFNKNLKADFSSIIKRSDFE